MPGKLLTSLRNTIPTVSSTTGPEYAQDINDVLTGILDDLEPSVKASEININGDLTFNENNATELAAAQLAEQAAALSGSAHAGKVYSFSNDLYYVNQAGTNVRITDGGLLNAAGLGGFTGDYGQPAVDAVARYTDSAKLYDFLTDDAPDDKFANVAVGNLRIYEPDPATGSNRVQIAAPAGLTGNYNLTLADGLPSSGVRLVTVDSTGELHDTEGEPTIDGNLALNGTFSPTGLITTGGGLDVTGSSGVKVAAGSTAITTFLIGTYAPALRVAGLPIGGEAYQTGHYIRINDWVWFYAKVRRNGMTTSFSTLGLTLPVNPSGAEDFPVTLHSFFLTTVTNIDQTGGSGWAVPSIEADETYRGPLDINMAAFVDNGNNEVRIAVANDGAGFMSTSGTLFQEASFTSPTGDVGITVSGWYKVS